MNILFVNSIGRNKFGGGEKWMVTAAKSLADRGHNVTLASKKNSRLLHYASQKGVKTMVMEIRSDFSPLKTLKVARYLNANRTDVLICNLNKDIRVAGLAARIAGNTAVLARHGMLLCSRKWKHRISLTRLCDGIITNSNTIKQTYAGYGWFPPEFVEVIYNGIVIPETIFPEDFSARFPGKRIIYSAGRLSEQKGFIHLIEAASMLAKTRNDLVFIVSGEGKLEHELKNRVNALGLEESFIFEGFTQDIYPWLKGCDLFVLASLFEGMPNVVMEAMAVEKPVVATDVNGARELMRDGITGLIVPPADAEALAAAIASVIDDPVRLKSLGMAGKKRVKDHFTVRKMADLLETHLLDKVAQKQTPR
ncbi:MAG: glycosyltransferase [Chlorobi bacterium]|nr:glycosyltransferase [Chlorobiota bacterium]